MYSGEHRYIFLPSTDLGIPALGWAASGREVAARTRSIASSIATGPTLQLHPITFAPHSTSFGTKVCGAEPSKQLPSSSMVTCATIGSELLTSLAASIA